MLCMCLKYCPYFNVYLCQSLFRLKIVRLNIVLCLSLTSIITMLFFLLYFHVSFFYLLLFRLIALLGPRPVHFQARIGLKIKLKRDPTAGHEERPKGAG